MPDEWSDWITHDHSGNPAPLGLPIMVDIEGMGIATRLNESGPWWSGGRAEMPSGLVATSPRILRYRLRRYAEAANLINSIRGAKA